MDDQVKPSDLMARKRGIIGYSGHVLPICIWRKTTIIIDCFEVFIERPSNVLVRSPAWNRYRRRRIGVVLFMSWRTGAQ